MINTLDFVPQKQKGVLRCWIQYNSVATSVISKGFRLNIYGCSDAGDGRTGSDEGNQG